NGEFDLLEQAAELADSDARIAAVQRHLAELIQGQQPQFAVEQLSFERPAAGAKLQSQQPLFPGESVQEPAIRLPGGGDLHQVATAPIGLAEDALLLKEVDQPAQ